MCPSDLPAIAVLTSPAFHSGFQGIEPLLLVIVLVLALLIRRRSPAPFPARPAAFASHVPLAGKPPRHLPFGNNGGLSSIPLLRKEPVELADFCTIPGDTPHLALMFLGIDGMKRVNAAHGRHNGNALLDETIERIRTALAPHDTVARLGNGRFAILAPGRNSPQAALLAGTLLREMQRTFHIAGEQINVTASIGIACTLNGGTPARKLMEHAGVAMRHAKSSSHGRYCFFEPAMADSQAMEQIALDLPQAIRNNELTLHYQPRFDIASGRMLGAEVLLRWQHPIRGTIPPSQFIKVAEQTGMICHLGNWVLDQACQQMRQWQDRGLEHPRLSVNVSAHQLNSPSFADDIARKLQHFRLPSSCLTLEITESAAMQDADASLLTLHRLAGMGVRISLDDFGVGHSSLLHLKRFPVSELKIDRGFIQDIENNHNDRAIVATIIMLARALELSVVAEGVETEGQRSLLAQLGCDSLQGYLLGEPMRADSLLADPGKPAPSHLAHRQ